jgi:predicted N-acetyltransferase YhbS
MAFKTGGEVTNQDAGAGGMNYRRMTENDVEAAHKLSLSVRWPHRLQDWKFVQRLGAGYVAENDTGVVGIVMCWSHGAEFASIGMVIVAAEWQGKGIGRKLADLIMAELGKRNVIMHATEAGRALYQKIGFAPFGETHQHQGTVFKSRLVGLQPGERIRPLGSRDGVRLTALAARASGMPRGTVLAALLETAECVVIDRYDEIIGCAMLRRFGHGYTIGPVIAPDEERAKALISHWTGTYAGSFVRIDVSAATGLSPWLNEIGLVQTDTAVVMARGEPPLQDAGMRQFAIISHSLG